MLISGTGRRSINIKGFTLLEMIIVITIFAIVLSIAAPNFMRYLHNTNLRTAGRDLAGDIYNYKQNAAAQSVHYKIIFNKDENTYKILKGGPEGTDSYDDANAIVKNIGSAASYVRIDDISYNNDQVIIQPRGTTLGGNVTLVNDIGSNITIITSWMGKVSVKYNAK